MKLKHFFLILFLLFLLTNTPAQMRYYTVKGGVQYNQTLLFAEFNHYRLSFLARGYFNVKLSKILSGELGIGYGRLAGTDAMHNPARDHWSTTIIPIDVRLRIAPFECCITNPYLYFGGGVLRYDVSEKHSTSSRDPIEEDGFTPMVFVGIGSEIKLSRSLLLDLSAGMTYAIGNIGIGFTFTGEPCQTDRDKDGLTRCYEEEIGTDPENEDTDGDGLRDGKEFVVTKTDPLKKDTDGDGLNDFEEVIIYKTDPLDPSSKIQDSKDNK
jgi:hypothetical protein